MVSLAEEQARAKAGLRARRHARLLQVQEQKSEYVANYATLEDQRKREILALEQEERAILDSIKNSEAVNLRLRSSYLNVLKASRKELAKDLSVGERSLARSQHSS